MLASRSLAFSSSRSAARHAVHRSRPSMAMPRAPRLRTAAREQTAEPAMGVQYNHILIPILDSNVNLSESSKQATTAAAALASPGDSKITVLVISKEGTTTENPDVQKENLSRRLADMGCKNHAFLAQETTGPASVVVGDTADQIEADLVVVGSQSIHSKFVDANLLTEFVGCPIMIVP